MPNYVSPTIGNPTGSSQPSFAQNQFANAGSGAAGSIGGGVHLPGTGVRLPGISSASSSQSVTNKYANVGKLPLNLLDIQQQAEAAQQSGQSEGGFFSGILGAIGGTFGEGGRSVGTSIGKAIEAPLGLLGGLPIPTLGLTNQNPTDHGPTLFSDIMSPFMAGQKDIFGHEHSLTLGGLVQSALGTFGLLGRWVERAYAGSDMRGALPQDLQAKIDSGEISRNEALDQAVLRGQGFTDNAAHNILWSILLDPLTWATLGVGAIGKTASAVNKVEQGLRLGKEAGTITEVGARLLGETTGHITPAAARAALAAGDTPLVRLGRLERFGLATVGQVPAPIFNDVLVPVANQITRLTDPLKFFGGGDIGKRSTEHLSLATTTGLIAAYKPEVYLKLKRAIEAASPGGGAELDRLIGMQGANYLQQFVIDEMASDAMKAGRIPFTTGEHGIALTPTEAAKALLGSNALDVNVGKRIEIMAEKLKPFGAGLSPEDMARQTRQKLAYISGAPESSYANVKIGYDQWALVHASYYYKLGGNLVDEVVPALRQMADTLPADIVPERLTLLGERTLTAERLQPLVDALKAENGVEVRSFINQYDDFNWINAGSIDVTQNTDLFDVLNNWMKANEGALLHEVPLHDATGALRADLPGPLAKWAEQADVTGYGLALAPPSTLDPSVLFRATRDAEGRLLNVRPWLDFTSESGAVAKVGGRFQATRIAMFRQIRAERILWTNSRNFTRNLVKRTQLPETVARRIYRGIMYTASDRGIAPRGLRPDEMYAVTREVLNKEGITNPLVTERSIVNEILIAFKGDLSQVGLTQGLTGLAKEKLPGASANFWGQVSERMYPMIRFTMSPWFLMQEYAEPYILNRMRGIPVPLRAKSKGFEEALATHQAINQLIRSGLTPDGAMLEMAEFQKILTGTVQEAHAAFGGASVFGKLQPGLWGKIADRKLVAAALETKNLFGRRLKETFIRMQGENLWLDLERSYKTTDAGEIAMQWMADNFHVVDGNGIRVEKFADLVNPANIGRATRIRLTGKGLTFEHLATFLGRRADAATGMSSGQILLDELRTGKISRDAFIQESLAAGVSPELTDRAFNIGSATWSVDDFWKGYRNAYLKTVKGSKAKDAEIRAVKALVDVRAAALGESPEEFLKARIAAPPEFYKPGESLDGVLGAAGTLTEMRDGLLADTVALHGGSFANASARADAYTATKPGPAFARVVGALFHQGGVDVGVTRRLMDELPTEAAQGHYFNHLAVNNPEALRSMLDPQLEKAIPASARKHVEAALAKAEELNKRPVMEFVTADGKIERAGAVSGAHLVEQNDQWMSTAEGRAAGDWYVSMRSRFTQIFGSQDGPVLLAFAMSQANSAPIDGLRNVLHVIEQMFAGGFETIKTGTKRERLIVGAVRRMAEGKLISGQLNEENIVRALLRGELPGMKMDRNFGAKLNDFLDSLLGNTSRRWMGRDASALQPVAVDRWTARDVGLLDPVAIKHLVAKYGRDAGNGVIEVRDRNERVVLRLRGVVNPKDSTEMVDWHFVGPDGKYVDRAGNAVTKPVSALDFTGAPTDTQYERGVRVINDAAKQFNDRNMWGRSDWTAADVQAVGWMRMQKVMGGMEQDPLKTFGANARVIATEVTGNVGTDWEKYIEQFSKLSPDRYTAITGGMNTWAAQRIRDLTGIVSVITDWAGPARWRGEASTISAPGLWLATPESANDVADLMAVLFRQHEVWVPHAVPVSSFVAAKHSPVVDIALKIIKGDDNTAKEHLTAIADALDAPGSTIIKDGEGNLILRIIDRPQPGEGDFFSRLGSDVGNLKKGMIDETATKSQIEAAIKQAGLDHETFRADMWHADVYIARGTGENAVGDTVARLAKRGRDVPEEAISGLRDEATTAVEDALAGGDPWNNKQRLSNGLLHEQRTGNVLGFTRTLDDNRVVLGALKGADPVTGLHELTHVFAKDLDPSAREIVQRAYEDVGLQVGASTATRRATLEKRVAEAQKPTKPIVTKVDQAAYDVAHADYVARMEAASNARETLRQAAAKGDQAAMDQAQQALDALPPLGPAPAKPVGKVLPVSRSTRQLRRYQNELNALNSGLGTYAPTSAWDARHEEFFVAQFQRWIKTGEANNTELVGVFNHFKNWLTNVWGAVKGQAPDAVHPEMEKLFNSMFDRPHVASVSYSVDQQALRMAGMQQLTQAQDEAFSTQFFKMGRSFAERTINHPFFGLYPFSYMFGKILPEMLRFVALRPFGLTAPLVGFNALRQVSDTVRAQSELDPSFRKFLSDNQELFYVMNTLFPATPNLIPINAPGWMRRIAQQGNANADLVASGQPAKSVDYTSGITDSLGYAFGLNYSAQQAGKLLGGAADIGRNVLGLPAPGSAAASGQDTGLTSETKQAFSIATGSGTKGG